MSYPTPEVHTPGPWAWEVTASGEIRLQTPDRGKLYVMGFARQGMRGAQPRFSLWGDGPRERRGGIMHDFIEAGGDEHPDARLIAAAPDLLAVVLELQESAAYWSEYDVPIGIVDRINAAVAKATGGAA
jgi:hypothetical protein